MNQLGSYWKISNIEKINEIKHSIFDKQWDYGTIEGGKATVLLDLVATIVYKSKHITEGKMIIGNDNKLLVKVIINQIQKENQFTIKVGAKVSMIKVLIAQLIVEINI